MLGDNLPRVPLAILPTPIEEMPRLSKALGGPRLLVKRDDETGLALGGNKTRKLEFLMADAVAAGSDVVITAGACQSNHARQTAAAAARLGLGCTLVLRGDPPAAVTGNLLLDRLLGAEVHWSGSRDITAMMADVAEDLRRVGRKPYIIPVGGSNAVGCVGYARALDEAMGQLRAMGVMPSHMVVCAGSGGTLAGMLVAAPFAGYSGRIIGVQVAPRGPEFRENLDRHIRTTAARLGVQAPPASTVDVRFDVAGPGYATPTEREREAIELAARHEALVLDPVYTGRTMAGLIMLVRSGELTPQHTVLFWHTGGAPGLFAYADKLWSFGP